MHFLKLCHRAGVDVEILSAHGFTIFTQAYHCCSSELVKPHGVAFRRYVV